MGKTGAVFINLELCCLVFPPVTDWREGRVPEPVSAEKVRKKKNCKALKQEIWELMVCSHISPSDPTKVDERCFCFCFCFFLPLSSTVKTSHSPVVSKIDNRLEQYTSAAQVDDAHIGEPCFQSVLPLTTAFARHNSVLKKKKRLASRKKNIVSDCDPNEI